MKSNEKKLQNEQFFDKNKIKINTKKKFIKIMIVNIFSIFDSNILNIPINKVIVLTIILNITINHNT